MANVEINDLTAKTTPDETDEIELQETAGGLSKKITRANFIPDASATVKGKVELATSAETTTGTDTERATTPAGVKAVADTKANTSHTHAAADVTSGVLANGRIATGTPDGTKFLRDDQVWTAIPGGGDALVANPLSQFAATTSLQLKGVLSDETGSGAAVFAESPALVTPTGIVKGDVGLGNVDNTADSAKPVSTATQTALDGKQNLDTDLTDIAALTPTNDDVIQRKAGAWTNRSMTQVKTDLALTKGDVGLGNVDNTSDANKPVSTATQTALDAKQASGATLTSLEGLTLAAGDILYATAADTLINLAKGTANQELRMNAGATAPEWYTPSAGGGQTTYDAIVAPSGGDYTTLGAAIAAASNGWSIFIKEGTYSESAINTSLTNLTIVGENPATTILAMTTNWLIFSGANVNCRNFGVTGSTGYMFLSGAEARADNLRLNFSGAAASTATFNVSGTNSVAYNCHILNTTTTGTPGSSTVRLTGNNSVMEGCYVYGPVRTAGASGSLFSNNGGLNTRIIGNTFEAGSTVSGAFGFYQGGTHATIAGNTFVAFDLNAVAIALSVQVGCSITGNVIRGGRVEIIASSTFTGNRLIAGSSTSYTMLTVTSVQGLCASNEFVGASTSTTTAIGVNSGSDRYSVIGNQISNWTTGVSVGAAAVDGTLISGNHFFGNTTAVTDSGTATDITSNYGLPATLEKSHMLMKNTSGATITAGEVVTYKSVAAGDEVTTTTAAGDTKVYGVATASIINTAYGYIQIAGKTTILKVNGTTDIAIGDFLSCFTTAGIAQKASAGQMAFAIALEAYTTDDSSGVIDALIISPRII